MCITDKADGLVHCKYCNGEDVIKFGKYKRVQRYWCRVCSRKFTTKSTAFKMKTPQVCVTEAIGMHNRGYPLRGIARSLIESYALGITAQAVLVWIRKYHSEVKQCK